MRRIAAVLVAALAVLAAGPTPAAAAPDPIREEIYAALRLQLDEVAAHYVIMVDTSPSMSNGDRYSRVRTALRAFLGGLDANDVVSLFTFNDNPEEQYTGPVGDPEQVLGRLPAIPTTDTNTDIGRAVNGALDVLKGDGSPIRAVVLISDGDHTPQPTSEYGPDGTGPAWAALKSRAAGFTDVQAYALEVGTGHAGRALGWAFANPQAFDSGTADLITAALERAKRAVLDAKVRRILADERGGITLTWVPNGSAGSVDLAAGHTTVTVDATSGTTHVPLTLRGFTATVEGYPATVTTTGEVTLAPGETKRVQVELRWDPPAAGVLRGTERHRLRLAPAGTPTTRWQPVLTELGLGFKPTLTAAPLELTAESRGPLRRTVGVLALLVLLLALLAAWWWRRHPAPSGRVRACLDPSAGGFGETDVSRLRTRLHGPDRLRLPGIASLRRRPAPLWRRRTDPEYEITYTPGRDRSRTDASTCPVNGSVIVNGMQFCHVADTGAACLCLRLPRSSAAHELPDFDAPGEPLAQAR